MIPTVFGLIVAVIGFALLVRGTVATMFSLVMLCGLMSGTAAVALPALGGSSIPPAQLALGFLVLRIFLPGSGQRPLVADAARANQLLVAYVGYGLLMAYVGPRMFFGAMEVTSLRPTPSAYLFAADPLRPSTQNVTTSVYLIGTLIAALGAYVAARSPRGPRAIVRTASVVAWIHLVLGVSGVLFADTAWTRLLDVFRNANYAQLDQSYGALVRMKGIAPEPSIYATFGVAWFIFLFECWYRNVQPRRTGAVALALGLTLLGSTSSTAYVGLGGYALVFAARLLFVPVGVDSAKLIRIVIAAMLVTVAVSAVFLLRPALASEFGDMLLGVTVGKQQSDSGLQRAFWARQGLQAFAVSWGLGIGPGSFRSSSLIAAILGSLGVAGTLLFAAYLLRVVKPLRLTTYAADGDERTCVGAAASWAALCLLIPAGFTAPSADPGTDFAIFAGIALALRRAGVAVAIPPLARATASASSQPGRWSPT